VSGKLWVLTGALLRFLNIMQNTCIFHWTRIKSRSSTHQFDHTKKTDTKGITSGYYVVLIGNLQELGLKLNSVFFTMTS